LRAVREVVVPGGDVVEGSGFGDSSHMPEVGGGKVVLITDSVQEVAGLGVVSVIVCVKHLLSIVAV